MLNKLSILVYRPHFINYRFPYTINYILLGIVFSIPLSHLFSQESLLGTWKTRTSNKFYGEFRLNSSNSNKYFGETYDEQTGGFCNYMVEGEYFPEENEFKAINTTLISKSELHLPSKYHLFYSQDDSNEYLKGTLEVIIPIDSSRLNDINYKRKKVILDVEYFKPKSEALSNLHSNSESNHIHYNNFLQVEDSSEFEYLAIDSLDVDKNYDSLDEDYNDTQIAGLVMIDSISNNQSIDSEELEEINSNLISDYSEEKLLELKISRDNSLGGIFESKGHRKLSITIVDYGEEDNDIISILLNDKVIANAVVIKNYKQTFEVNIDPNIINEVTFIAHNTGRIPPNTCDSSFIFGKNKYHKKIFTDEKTNSLIRILP